ncbi:MAG: GIY-YIG nuclease family protein [Desulfobacterales bacterium]|jgi:Uri superfamily endonuclease
MQNSPGTYALIGACDSNQQLIIGKLGRLHVRPGTYVYIGSAFGPGGLKARIAHHTRCSVRPHWHIDYLRSVLRLREVWYTVDARPYEHRWAETMSALKGATLPIIGFGASDCSCTSHLFAFTDQPLIRSFRRRLHTRVQAHGSIFQHKLID